MKPVKSLALIYWADMFIKTKFKRFLQNRFKYKKEFITPFEEISPQWLSKIGRQKFYLLSAKNSTAVCSFARKIVIVGNSKRVRNFAVW